MHLHRCASHCSTFYVLKFRVCGGVLRDSINMSYLRTIRRLSATDNIGGIIQLQVARVADVIDVPEPIAGIIVGDITFQPGTGFVSWECRLESANMRSRTNASREGSVKANSLPFILPKDRQSIKAQLDQAEDDEFIVLYKDSNGSQVLFGTPNAPLRFRYDHSSGTSFDSLNAYEAEFYYEGPDNRSFYQGAVTTPPPGTGPSTVQHADGTLIATLNPSDELVFTSDFEHTFTLVPGPGPAGTPAIVKWSDGTIIAALQPGDILIVDTDFTFDFEIIGDDV